MANGVTLADEIELAFCDAVHCPWVFRQTECPEHCAYEPERAKARIYLVDANDAPHYVGTLKQLRKP